PSRSAAPPRARRWLPAAALCLLLVLSACRSAPVTPAASAATPVPATRGIVVAAHPLAVDAGTAVLRRGGSAIDAAVAVQEMLGLVEPQSSGLGGGTMILVYDASSGEVSSYVGREAAPSLATPQLLDDEA